MPCAGPALTLDVPVHDHVAVQVGDALEDLPRVFARDVLGERPVRLQLVLHRALPKNTGHECHRGDKAQISSVHSSPGCSTLNSGSAEAFLGGSLSICPKKPSLTTARTGWHGKNTLRRFCLLAQLAVKTSNRTIQQAELKSLSFWRASFSLTCCTMILVIQLPGFTCWPKSFEVLWQNKFRLKKRTGLVTVTENAFQVQDT